MSRNPQVSVLVPTFGYADYLPELVRSIRDQAGVEMEVLVADDGSGDGSEAVARAASHGDPRIRVVRHAANLGMVANWNWCLAQARGRYVKFMFGDDRIMAPDALRQACDLLDRHPSASLAASARLVLDPAGQPLGVRNELGPTGYYAGAETAARCLWADANLIGGPSCVIFRRDAGLRGFDPQLRQLVDLEFWLHLLQRGGLAYLAAPLFGLRRHAAQASVHNMRANIGPAESAIIAARYLPLIAGPHRSPFRAAALHAHCFRKLHYLRKSGAATPAAREAGRILARAIPRAWHGPLWLWHRLSKPVRTACGHLQRARGRDPRAGVSPPLDRPGAAAAGRRTALPLVKTGVS